ncbi:hypothetical protein [Cytobacillus sp. FSL R5-0596]|uniref:hypothetical protein n=1 Tax=Cytobacillus sp. FSL R5-0596 TaxID=2954696 RepID=UPI0030F887AA
MYTYVDEKGIHINSASNIRTVESYPWEEVESVTQLNKRGTPVQIEVSLKGDKKIVLHLDVDWYAKRSAFYEMLRDYEIPLDTREK